jgi:signal transduction histidine kinase
MASGDLSQPVKAASDYDEVITLARTFERMRIELERSHLALTRRVRERDELIQLKEEFLANVSHELRTPLNVIIGYTDMLLDDSRQHEAKDFLQRIRSQSEHLYQLLQDVMTLSALNAGKIAVELQTVSIPDMLSRLRPTVEACRQGRDIEVKCDVPGDLPPLVTDPSRLEQVLANLINNAFKFTPEGRVEIRARHDRQQQRLIFEVADTGIGIPEEEMDHVFDEFRQIDGSMHREHEGMGLGLALVRKLTNLLEGDLRVDSHVHEGTTVTVSLPLHLRGASASRSIRLSS